MTRLSPRAEAFLTTLERRPAVPVEIVRARLEGAGAPAIDAWLAFHERFAGYVEPIGQDVAVWGLVHDAPTWLPPRDVDVEHDRAEGLWLVACADVHPSYAYWLDERGELLAGPAERFEIHVERLALRAELCAGAPPHLDFNVKRADLLERIRTETALVPEASDRYQEHYAGERILAIREVAKDRWVEVLSR